MNEIVIAVDDPRADDVRALIERHLAFAHKHTPSEAVYALDLKGLVEPAVTFFSGRRAGELLAIGALKELAPSHGEVKSMHTAVAARRIGIARAMVGHLIAVARERQYRRLSLETGTQDVFAPARSLYANAGFTPCGPFGDYPLSPTSAFMTLELS